MTTHLTKDGRQFSIRIPTEADAQNIMDYAKVMFASTDQVLTTLEEYTISLEDEKKWINSALQNSNMLILIAELNNQVIGLLDFSCKAKRKNAHTGEFGVSVHPNYQGIGVGRLLIENLISWAKENKQVKKVFLNVFHTNTHAIKLYKDLGFEEEGRHIKAIKQATGEYVDLIQMYMWAK